MSLSADEIIKVLATAKDLGVSNLKVEGIEASFGEKKELPPVTTDHHVEDGDIEDAFPKDPVADLTDEEILYYATPYYDQLQAKKAEHKKALEEEAKERT